MIRVDGDMRRVNVPALDHAAVQAMVYDIMNDKQRKDFEEKLETDFSFEIPDTARFRVNAFNQNRGCGAMDYKNESELGHILTIEDPIEFVHESKKCLMNQREVHRDTFGFSNALRSALREDPDVILVGEMRDMETISLALTAAETGHLVFGTLHTSSAAKTVDRIVDVFPAGEKPMVRSMLSESLRAVISQTLLKKTGGGRVACLKPAKRPRILMPSGKGSYRSLQLLLMIGKII